MKKLAARNIVLITLVFIIALFLRLWKISEFPVSMTIDEVGFGYDAYSILETGKDSWGEKYPLVFKAIGDYKPAVDVYITSLSISAFGLNEFGTRFPVAFLGSLACIALIFVLLELEVRPIASIFGGFWIAVSPWAIHFSRANFEATIALFFVFLGVWQIISWSKQQKTYQLSLSIASFALSVWSYNAERLFIPVLFIFLIILFKKQFIPLFKKPKKLIIPVVTLLVFLIPFLYLGFFTDAIRSRPLSTSIFREQSLTQSLHYGSYKNITEKIFDNDLYLIFRHWFGKYSNYFDLRFWFWKGMQFTPAGYPDMGILYAVDLPLILYGLYAFIKSNNKTLKSLTIFWFFAGPISASLTMNEQHPLRSLIWILFFGILVALALERFITKIKGKWILGIYFGALAINAVYFGDIYIHQFPRFFSEYWQYGYKQIAQYACNNLEKYDKIFISDTFGSLGPLNTGVPVLYSLFYCKADRDNYLATGKHIDKLQFRRPNKDSASEKGKLLLIGSPWDFLDGNIYNGVIVKKIVYPNGVDAFLFVEKQ